MRGLALAILLLISAPRALADRRSTALSQSGIETIVSWETKVLLPKGVRYSIENIDHLIRFQISFLMGVFQSPEYAKKLISPDGDTDPALLERLRKNKLIGYAGLGQLERFHILGHKETERGIEIHYRARQGIMFLKDFIHPKEVVPLTLYLPYDPNHIYSKLNTDAEYPQKEFYWYFWDYFKHAGMQDMKREGNEVREILASARGLVPPSPTKRPKIDKLLAQAKKDGELRVSILVGFDHSSSDPTDAGRDTYDFLSDWLEKKEFVIDRHRNIPTGPFVDFVKAAEGGMPAIRISLSLSSVETTHTKTFARRAREGFEHGHAVIVQSHNELGATLDLFRLARESSPDPSRPVPIRFAKFYQVYVMDCCNTFHYYPDMYEKEKDAPENVDIITNALPSMETWQNQDTVYVLNHIINPRYHCATWLEILSGEEAIQGGRTYLSNVFNVPAKRKK